jgi:hypothetical protein
MKLSDTQRVILSRAAEHPQGLAYPPERLPAAARQTVAKALLKHDLVIAVHRPAYDAIAKWTVDGDEMLLKVTDAGLRAIGIEPEAPDAEANEPEDTRPRHERNGVDPRFLTGIDEDDDTAPTGAEDAAPQDQDAQAPEPAQAAPTPAPRANLRDAAQRILDAWDDDANQRYDLADAIDALRSALAGKPARAPREPGAPRKPREGTKQETVLALLRRDEGATIAQIVEATGWQQHTVRGFFAGLKKRQRISVVAAERIRQVGPNKEGARGSYTIYRVEG